MTFLPRSPFLLLVRPWMGIYTLLLCVLLTTVVIAGCGPAPNRSLTLEEAKVLKYRVTVNGVAFDIPVNYSHAEYAMFKRWPSPTKEELEGRVRRKVDVIKMVVLMPDMEPYTERNAKEFDRHDWGDKVSIFMTTSRADWEYYYRYTVPLLQRLPDIAEMPGMYRYRDPALSQIVYLSHKQPASSVTRIICPDQSKAPSPYCKVDTQYTDHFDLKVAFSQKHLGHWRMIDRKVKSLLNNLKVESSS